MFQGPVYIVTNAGVTISTAITSLQLKAGVNGPFEVLRAAITQGTTTTSAACRVGFIRKSAAATVTIAVAGTNVLKGNTVNPTTDLSLGTSATGFTASAEGTDSELSVQRGINVLNGYELIPAQEERLMVPQGGFFAAKFLTAPPSATWDASITIRELRAG